MDLVGNGGANAPAWATTFLPACGMLETSGSFAFVTGSTTAKTLTVSVYEDGKTRTLYGCVGTWSMALTAGEIGKISFDLVGIYGTDADVALLTPAYPTTLPPRWANASGCAFGAYTPILSSATLAANNTMKLREDANAVSGFKAGIITDRFPTFEIDPETDLVATKNWMSEFLASTRASLAFVLGTATNNVITVTYPKAQITSAPNHEDRDGVMVTKVSGNATRNASAGDDCCTVVFT